VPIETYCAHRTTTDARDLVAFTPKGGCPLKLSNPSCKIQHKPVAFTPKGGCPLKLCKFYDEIAHFISSIHPQGWVPIETCTEKEKSQAMCNTVAFTPKGGCPLKQEHFPHRHAQLLLVAFTPKGGCPLKQSEIAPCGVRPHTV